MVDAVVSFVVQRLGDYLIQEAVLLQGVSNEVRSLKDELERMQCFIKDAEEKQVDDAMIRKWVSDIRDIAYDVEDVLDAFMLGKVKRKPRFFPSIKKCSCISNQDSYGFKIPSLYRIGKDIEVLRRRINDLSRNRELYHLQDFAKVREEKSNTLETLKELRKAPSFSIEEDVVGFEDEARDLLAKLLDEEPRRFVISTYGMGGLGKTTLAKKLYHHIEVKSKFNHKAWVSVSQDYNTRDLLLRIIESFNIIKGRKEDEEMKKIEKMRKEQLERCIYELLQESSYLLVIDDVWQKEAWESLKRAFPDHKNGNRVIITTRIKEVAERSDDRTHIHHLRFLSQNEGWKLFCEKAFRNSVSNERLERMGREMVEKCGGLPLAIVVLGGLLSTKKPNEWREVRDHIWRHLKEDSIHISALLDLSFNDLPYQLKLCFLYLGLFPEDYEINVQNLIRLLVAEGFILEDGDLIMEEVAQNNVTKLINRSLVQIDKKCWGRITTCRIHDLLRDLAIEKAKQLNFIHIYDEIKHSSSSIHYSITSSSRRQAIYSGSEKFLWFQQCNPFSRSLLFFNQQFDGSLATTHQFKHLCSRFLLLRVLDVEVLAKSLPTEIGKLVHLKYLVLRVAFAYNLPSSIVNLQWLQTLELNSFDRFITTLPTEISKLQELRHLTGFFEGPLSIDNLAKLQTLKYVNYDSWTTINTEKLVNLRELQLELGGTRNTATFSLESVSKLKSLRILSIWLGSSVTLYSLQPLGHCQCLIDLRLNGKIEKLPRDMDELFPNLECVKLANSLLKDDPMPSLEKLPNLIFLVCYDCYIGKKLRCTANGFPRLEILQLLGLNELGEWQIDEDAMPMLRGLTIRDCYNLRIPERLRSIPLPAEWDCIDRLSINKSRYHEL